MSKECAARTILVYGEVKHVGFRRFVWGLAKRLGLRGYVSNLPENGVKIYVEGEPEKIERFEKRVSQNKVYKVERIEVRESECRGVYNDFMIIKCASEAGLYGEG